jgi:hypothetical protein
MPVEVQPDQGGRAPLAHRGVGPGLRSARGCPNEKSEGLIWNQCIYRGVEVKCLDDMVRTKEMS